VTLLISQVAEVDATLQVGGMSESVEVTSAPPILQTEDSTLSANLNNEAVSELPLNVQGSRNLSNFMFAYLPAWKAATTARTSTAAWRSPRKC